MGKYIYLAGVLENLQIVSYVIIFLLVFGWVSGIAIGLGIYYGGDKDNIFLKIVRNKLYILALVFTMILNIILPSKEEIYAIVITDKVLTQENYNKSIDEAKKLIDYTIDKIKEFKEK